MKIFLGIVFAFAVVMLLLNLGGVHRQGVATPHPNILLRAFRTPPPGVSSGKQAGTVVLYAIGGIAILALAWWLSSAPRVLGAVSLPLAGYLAYGQIYAPSQTDAVAIVSLFLAIATGLSQLRGKA